MYTVHNSNTALKLFFEFQTDKHDIAEASDRVHTVIEFKTINVLIQWHNSNTVLDLQLVYTVILRDNKR